ncbi:MAG: universal stress protein [Phascolarctobacterium sp.]|nr:universal stress protein [Phascolarctobacterium sp.]
MFKKILIPVDGSTSSFDALDLGIELANSLKADIVVMTVVQTTSVQGWSVDPDIKTKSDNVTDEMKMAAHILDMAKIKAQKADGKVEAYNKLGYPSDTIVETAKATGCDCIVIGSRGLSGIQHILLGSVSEKVAQLSNIPVLIVK